MKRLRFEYSTSLKFSGSVSEHCFTLRCLPISDGRQLIREPFYEIAPNAASGRQNGLCCSRNGAADTMSAAKSGGRQSVWFSRDGFGNILLCGRIPEPHDSFSFSVSGEAEIIGNSNVPGFPAAVYGYESTLTKAGSHIVSFYEQNAPSSKKVLDRALELSQSLFSAMTYKKGVTGVNTTAEEALASGEGVCQDYAHIFLALCRLDGIRCRYVSGLAYNNGETHAWTEIADNSKWYGIDPANNRLIGEHYIKICHGRDYSDCPIERGIYLGNSESVQTVTSSVVEI